MEDKKQELKDFFASTVTPLLGRFGLDWKQPQEISYKDLDTTDFELIGMIDNPDAVSLDYKKHSFKIINLNDLIAAEDYQQWSNRHSRPDSTIETILEYVKDNYAQVYIFPGIEFQKYLFENKDSVSETLKDGAYYLIPGSMFYNGRSWCCSIGYWSDGLWHCEGMRLKASAIMEPVTTKILFLEVAE